MRLLLWNKITQVAFEVLNRSPWQHLSDIWFFILILHHKITFLLLHHICLDQIVMIFFVHIISVPKRKQLFVVGDNICKVRSIWIELHLAGQDEHFQRLFIEHFTPTYGALWSPFAWEGIQVIVTSSFLKAFSTNLKSCEMTPGNMNKNLFLL